MSDSIADIEARRQAKKNELAAARDAQKLIDLTAIEALEIEKGFENIAVVEINYVPGLPVLLAAGSPSPPLIKRYQDRLQAGRNGKAGSPLEAAQEIGAACRVYPSDEVFREVLAKRPSADVALGVAAIKLVETRAESEGKG